MWNLVMIAVLLFAGQEMCPGKRSSTLPQEFDRSAESHILLDPYGRRSVNATGYVSSKDSEVHPKALVDPSMQPFSQMIPNVSFQTLGGDNELNHTANVGSSNDMGNVDTITTKKIGLQGNYTGVVVGIPEPTKWTKYVDLSTIYPTAGRDEEHSRHPDSNSSGRTDASKVVSGKKRVLKPKANGRTSQHILSQNLFANSNDRMRCTLPNFKASTNHDERMLGIKGFPETCSLPQSRSKRKTSLSVEVGDIDKEKVASSAKKFPENEVKTSSHNSCLGKLLSDACEPRRSSRIRQPTLRLLEGLQTSVSDEKDTKLGAGARGNKRS
ncbi:hypothetical protein FRX31_024721 [Thalictrum thalictroides]|uniref:Uncharacterized protein n=1 Tax=Thalictrum thalictroides TaxID=46969 RepID=A0A7J6VLQ2_THATH|nr:hypothetical protein FRX31_024721 [Thalictrum thalictroides]